MKHSDTLQMLLKMTDLKEHSEALKLALKLVKRHERAEEKKAKAAAGAYACYQEMVGAYYEWHELRVGIKPMMNPQRGKAMNNIIGRLMEASTDKSEQGAKDAWEYILNHWEGLTPFLQKQVSLLDIERNLEEIIMHLKHAATTTNKTRKASTESVADRIRNRRAGTGGHSDSQD